MSKHLDAFDECVVRLQSLGEPNDESRQRVVLLSSLPKNYELIVSIVENAKEITVIEIKEKLLKEHKRLQKKKTTEKAFPVHGSGEQPKSNRGRGRKDYGPRKSKGEIKKSALKCNRVGHIK